MRATLENVLVLFELQMVFHSGSHDGRVKRLGDVIDGSQSKTQDLFLVGVLSGHENNGEISRLGVCLDRSTDLMSVQAGHHHIQKDKIGGVLGI